MGRANREKQKYTEHDIQKALFNQYLSNPQYALMNLFVFDWESDFLAKTSSGYWYEVEIKISVADFKNDSKNKKEKFKVLNGEEKALKPNYFSYCVPVEIKDKILPLLPEFAGLYTINCGGFISCVRQPKTIHKEKIADDKLSLTKKFYYNMLSWRNKYEGFRNKELKLKGDIDFLKAEFKAATGSDIKDYL